MNVEEKIIEVAPSVEPVVLVTETEWARTGTTFSPRTRADKTKKLPGGVYTYVKCLTGWYLNRTTDRFEFPFKVYDASPDIIERVTRYWKSNGGNLGVLLNGLRGAGKTMAAQELANNLIDDLEIPVLVVREPIDLQAVFDNVQQDMMVIFDEFEKTHNNELHEGAQQKLLSTIDGMGRSLHNRLFIFTTNETEIDINFRDRPSRIHYKFEFRRVADEVIEGLLEDSLPKDLHHFKSEIFDYLSTRDICTIDIVKAVIAEVKTFREPPATFEGLLNIAKGMPPAFTVYMLDPKTNEDTPINEYFRLSEYDSAHAPLLSGNARSIEEFSSKGHGVEISSNTWEGPMRLRLIKKCEEEYCWLAEVRVSRNKTIWGKYSFLHNTSLYLDEKPEGWKLPGVVSVLNSAKLKEEVEKRYDDSVCSGTEYGTGKNGVFKLRIEPNRDNCSGSPYVISR